MICFESVKSFIKAADLFPGSKFSPAYYYGKIGPAAVPLRHDGSKKHTQLKSCGVKGVF
jgi:hypothetical protein